MTNYIRSIGSKDRFRDPFVVKPVSPISKIAPFNEQLKREQNLFDSKNNKPNSSSFEEIRKESYQEYGIHQIITDHLLLKINKNYKK